MLRVVAPAAAGRRVVVSAAGQAPLTVDVMKDSTRHVLSGALERLDLERQVKVALTEEDGVVLVHAWACETAARVGCEVLSMTVAEVLSLRVHATCRPELTRDASEVNLARAVELLEADEVLGVVRTLNMLEEARGAAQQHELLVPGLEEALAEKVRELDALRRAWVRSAKALRCLEVLSAYRSCSARLLGSQVLVVGRDGSEPRDLEEVLTAPARTGAEVETEVFKDSLSAAHAGLVREGEVLVAAASGTAWALVDENELLVEALEQFERPETPSVLVLPRSLEALAAHPRASGVSSVVVPAGTSAAVLEVAVRLLADGGVSASEALEVAQELA